MPELGRAESFLAARAQRNNSTLTARLAAGTVTSRVGCGLMPMTKAGEAIAGRFPEVAEKGAFPGWPSYATVQGGLDMETDEVSAQHGQSRRTRID